MIVRNRTTVQATVYIVLYHFLLFEKLSVGKSNYSIKLFEVIILRVKFI